MDIIAAVDKRWGIGKSGTLLISIPEDMKKFKEITKGQTVIMGRKTFNSLPGGLPLPERKNIIVTKSHDFNCVGANILHSVDEVSEYVKNNETGSNKIFCIGGGEIYNMLLPLCQKAYITYIDEDFDADTFAPNLNKMGWKYKNSSSWKEYEGIRYIFREYINPVYESI